jgi:hypothetical protein
MKVSYPQNVKDFATEHSLRITLLTKSKTKTKPKTKLLCFLDQPVVWSEMQLPSDRAYDNMLLGQRCCVPRRASIEQRC